ncbi:MAG: pyridoxal-phosphate dependent enzyme [Cyclobacteriaceae bacterium]|jgi:threonine dehydratase|nr:pyridoxal-phosphate dependent enzyme [Cyclobacteriaceae bacterium]
MINEQDIYAAHERIKSFIHRTPVLQSTYINNLAGCEIFFKCENFQKVGAFKARGAMNAALQIPIDVLQNGIATHSSGNHAQAIARAASILKVPAFIVMPKTAPQIKKNGVLGYGGKIFECDPTLQAREETLAQVIVKTKATEIHPFNNEAVIAGQATACKELLEDVNNLDIVMAPVGGGGLLSGTALAAHFIKPSVDVIAGEPSGADDAYRSLISGKIEQSQSNTIADGLLTNLGTITFPIIQEHVKKVICVSDDEIMQALQLVWEKLKIIIEPSCAVPLAALLKEKEKFKQKKVGIILTGGNVDLAKLVPYFK